MGNNDMIKRYSKFKGYESIPRDLLQSSTLSLEAIGLLCHLQSLPESYEIYKTVLKRKFCKNGSRSIDRIWDELVSEGYILQFRKREGKKYFYQYIFNVVAFNAIETQELLESMHKNGYLLYHKKMKIDKKSSAEKIDILKFIFLKPEEKNKLDVSFWNSQNAISKKADNSNDCSTLHFEVPTLEGSKCKDSKLTNKRLEEEDIYNNTFDFDLKNSNKDSLIVTEKINHTKNYLLAQKVDIQDVERIIEFLIQNPELNSYELIQVQAQHTERMAKNRELVDYAEYFIRGLLIRKKNLKIGLDQQIEKRYQEEMKKGLPKVSMHNWLE